MNVLETILYPVIDDFNDTQGDASLLKKDPACILYGENSVLESMALVSFVIRVQQFIEENHNLSLELAHEKALSRKNSPFRSVGSLADYVVELMEEAKVVA